MSARFSITYCGFCGLAQPDVGLVRGNPPRCLACGEDVITDGGTEPIREFTSLSELDLKVISTLIIDLETEVH